MRLTSLELNNFGVFQGENRFDFGEDKPVVLVGGMNGRGKTTFLEAVLAALYGSNSFIYLESGYSTFGQYLRAHTNTDAGDTSASVFLSFLHDMDGVIENITVARSWDVSGKYVFVDTAVLKDGAYDAFLTENWAAYVEDILPRALSGFFFFDGEKIAELALDGSDTQIGESIRALLGVSTVDVLRKDLGTICRKLRRSRGSDCLTDELETQAKAVDALKDRISMLDSQLGALRDDERALEKTSEILRSKYVAVGGEAMARRASFEERKRQIKLQIVESAQEGVLLCSGNAPLAMFADSLPALLSEVKNEFERDNMVRALSQLGSALDAYQGDSESIKDFLEFVRSSSCNQGNQHLYRATTKSLSGLAALVAEIPELRSKYRAFAQKRSSLSEQLAEVEDYLSVSFDEAAVEEVSIALDQTTQNLAETKASSSSLGSERSAANGEYIRKNAKYKRLMKDYLAGLNGFEDDERALSYAQLAGDIFERYAMKIQEGKVTLLAETITECYKSLANKTRLIDRIEMDAVTLELSCFGPEGSPVDRQLLSAGEKQLMVIATLWALAKCSDKKLPIIIDTPLARLDSSHRLSIVESYFPNASDQTIILSTDSEIFGEYYEALKPNVSDEFTLVYKDSTRSTSVKRGYFTEAER